MTLGEFIILDPKKIRRSEELMRLFVDFYEAAFLLRPNCAGCAFKKGFNRLKKYHKKGNFKQNIKTMDTKTFVVKPKFRTKILRYKENGITYRKYGHALTEEFAKKLVAHGRGDVFAVAPQEEGMNYSEMDWSSEILPLYAEVKERTGEKAESRKKDDIIAFLKVNEG